MRRDRRDFEIDQRIPGMISRKQPRTSHGIPGIPADIENRSVAPARYAFVALDGAAIIEQ